jgi:ribA/ribD-fused uncharacterized protein
MTESIRSFRGKYRWLSNFEAALVVLDGVEYVSTEHAYQAAKSLDHEVRKQFRDLTCREARNLGQTIEYRPDWEDVKLSIMEDLNRQKFTRHKALRWKLLATGDAELVEGNTWHDNFWGDCQCTNCVLVPDHRNELGKLLMRIRAELRAGDLK